jgi:two-component system, NarL family, nitrate/nitrite response regulator NarL
MIDILHIDPDADYHRTLQRILSTDLLTITASHDSVDAALAGLNPALPPDVVLLDTAKGDNPTAAIGRLKAAIRSVRIIILTDIVSIAQLSVAFEAGVMGYLAKRIAPHALTESIMLVVIGEKVFPAQLADFLVEKPLGQLDAGLAERRRMLTPKELQVMQHVKLGYSNKEIAAIIGISDMTVRLHLNSAFRKMNVKNRIQGALWMIEHEDQVEDWVRQAK